MPPLNLVQNSLYYELYSDAAWKGLSRVYHLVMAGDRGTPADEAWRGIQDTLLKLADCKPTDLSGWYKTPEGPLRAGPPG